MRVIDAFWEKRNLGVETVEINIDINDKIEDIKKAIEEVKAEYVVVKVPAGYIDAMFLLNDMGYKNMETIIHATHNLKNIELEGIQKRINDSVSYEPMNDDDIEELFQEIKKGLFTTDRIYLDPYFTKEQASNRYIGWIKDELSRGTEAFKLIYKDKSIGFFMFKETEKDVYYPFLAGVYEDYRSTGLGFTFNYKPICEAIKRNGKMISTFISSNNNNTVRMHSIFGFQFNKMDYVYIKHN